MEGFFHGLLYGLPPVCGRVEMVPLHEPVERAAGKAGLTGSRRDISHMASEQVHEKIPLKGGNMLGPAVEEADIADLGLGRPTGCRHDVIG